ncbi:MAG: enoyl-CoA hydratase/isomerase family protein [Myxococcota bacterium]
MTRPAVYVEREADLAILTLDRPENRNSMTPELLDAFSLAVDQVRASDARCVIITGHGPSFCGGADFRAAVQREAGPNRLAAERSFAMYEPFLKVLDLEVPVIAAMNGHAVGGGFGLSLLCDIRVACANARHGANFTRLGLHPGLGISWLLPRLVGVPRATELLLTGRLFSGTEGEALGLFHRAVAADEVHNVAWQLARDIAANAPIAVRLTKGALQQGVAAQVREAARQESFIQAATLDTDDVREGVAALLEKRPPVFRGR